MLTLNFHHSNKDVYSKPPKLRFRPGNVLRKDNVLYEVIYCFRVADRPHEWLFCLEDRKSLIDNENKMFDSMIADLNDAVYNVSSLNRIEYRLFRTSMEASSHFFSIACRGTERMIVSNKILLNDFILVSSGMIE